MTDRFRGWQVVEDGGKPRTNWRTDLAVDELADGDVVIDVSHAGFNYKDGLAMTGKAPIVRRFPCVPGIDLAGTVVESPGHGLVRGDVVLVTGFGLGETHDGGFAERARVRHEWVMKLPPPFTAAQGMAIGTAGFTAMLAVQALEQQGVERPAQVLVTGAGGGVGSMAISLLAAAGFAPVAVSGRPELEPYLKELGAVEVLPRSAVASAGKGPLDRARWAAAIDTVGGAFLADILKAMRYEGTVAACGLVGGGDLPTTVYPFILRGVRLIGIDSVQQPMFKRDAAWGRLAVLLDAARLDRMMRIVGLADLPQTADEILAGKVRGRVVVDVKA